MLNLNVSGIKNEITIGKSFALTWDHVHFAFANVTEDFEVDILAVEKDFTQFKGYSSLGKIPKVFPSVVGRSQQIYVRTLYFEKESQMSSVHCSLRNVVQLADDNDLDGLEFDWKYPGAPDIPDPHGQWDYNSTYSLDGCNGSNCLRSHVNRKETTNSLSMITKAGIPNSKIVAGLASYGRSFGMKVPSSHGPECKFTGPESASLLEGVPRLTDTFRTRKFRDGWIRTTTSLPTLINPADPAYIILPMVFGWLTIPKTRGIIEVTTWHDDKTVLGTSLRAIDLTEFVTELPNGQLLPSDYDPVEFTRSFDSLGDLEAATGIDDYYIMDDSYNSDFNWYKKAIQASAPGSLKEFLKAHVDEYFDCTRVQMDIITQGAYYKYEWEAKDKDKNRFETDILNSAEISPDWLLYGYDGSHCPHDLTTGLNQCSGSVNDGIHTLEGVFTISNPKDIISDQLPKLKNFHTQLGVISTLSASDAYDGDTNDVADGASTLALMVSQSVTSMKQVAKIGEDFEDDWIKFIAITFVTALLYDSRNRRGC
ncbi:Glycoside hydrolase, superfamily [Penicillium italicum]|uniref:Glycoside hydrolase, superfamily n=1 Tax=Penicillium italicum TaxID=40296 RepID=A0A0A2KKW0_PENIT|nr:Glycoside hydrolase, superfamily [Penicillium italicum]